MPDLISSQLVEIKKNKKELERYPSVRELVPRPATVLPRPRTRTAIKLQHASGSKQMGHVKFWCHLPHPSSEQHTVCTDLSKNSHLRVLMSSMQSIMTTVGELGGQMRSLQADVTEMKKGRQQRRRRFRRTRWFLIRFRIERWCHDRVW